MSWVERIEPARMARVALVAPSAAFRQAVVAVADAGVAELEVTDATDGPAAAALRAASAGRFGAVAGDGGSTRSAGHARLIPDPPDLGWLTQQRRTDLLEGEAELEARLRAAVTRGTVSATAAWVPATEMGQLSARLAPLGAAAVALAPSPGVDPPTLLPGRGLGASFRPLVDIYATVPYRDVDPSILAGLAYVFMFGMMFGDVGHGAVLVAAGLALRAGRPRPLARFRRAWPFVLGAGLAAAGFGVAYGEVFGPTGVVHALWLAPLDRPTALLAAAIGVGAVLLGVAYVAGSINRFREGGLGLAAVATTGLAGSALYAGLAMVAAGWYWHHAVVVVVGGAMFGAGLALVAVGLVLRAGYGASGAVQVAVELFDTVVRLGSNVVSFTRLAAFGLTHAALGSIVWSATVSLWHRGGVAVVAAAAVLVVGNALAFALEALVAGVQALRLEYYELFSRIFATEGRPFQPWHVPTALPEELP